MPAGLLRYLAPAALIVLGALALAFAVPWLRGAPPRVPYTSPPATPKAGGAERDDRTPEPVDGIAPWALAAVPECFRETSRSTGSAAFARAHIPRGARPAGGGRAARLATADCALVVRGDRAELRRGDNRLTLPVPARFSVAGRVLVLDERVEGHEEVRLYTLRSGAAPAFAPLP
jgi:hypothetical protein